MPNWKKLILSGSDAELNSLNVTSTFTASGINYPPTDGDNGDTLITDGAGNLSFARTTVYANVKNVHGSELVKGMPVHVTGAAGNTSEVIVASASNAATMPAHFILNETLADDAEGLAIAVGYINQVNTGDFNEGDTVYVGADGGYTNVKPTGSNLIQNLGIVDKVDASNGSGFILGAGRSNDVPNIASGYAWVGNSDSVATAVATSSFVVTNANTASYVAASNIDGTIDISDQTNLAGGTNLTLSGDTMNLDANISLTSITASGNISSSGTSDNFFGGRIVLDNAKYFVGTQNDNTTTRNLLSIDASNITQIGNANIATNIKGTSITLANDTTIQGTLAIDGIANVSASIASAGGGGAVATYTNGSNNRIITSTGTDGINGETALTFDGATLEVTARQEFFPSNAIRGIYTDIETNWESAVLVSSGEYIEVGADVSRTQHDLFNLSGSWSEANNGDVSTAIGLLGVAINATSGNEWLVKGTFNIAQTALAGHPAEIGSPVYIGATNGKYTVTPPTSAGDVVRVVGHIADTYVSGRTTYYKIYFNPSPDWIEL